MARYLIFKLGAFGDLSFSLPWVNAIRQVDSESEITWVAGKSYSDFLEKFPNIDRVISVDEKSLFQGSFLKRFKTVLLLWLSLRRHYDQIWIGHRTLGAFFLMRLGTWGTIHQVVRSPSSFLEFFRREHLIPPLSIHESLAFRSLAEQALQKSVSWELGLRALSKDSNLIIHIGGGSNEKTEFHLKKWPYWKELIEKLLQTTSYSILLVGAPSEKEEAQKLMASLASSKRVVSRVGETTLHELVLLLSQSVLVIGVDSGPLHWADAMGVPCLGLYGPTSSVSWGLLGAKSHFLRTELPCSPCYQDDGFFPPCPIDQACMKGITVEQVLDAMRKFS